MKNLMYNKIQSIANWMGYEIIPSWRKEQLFFAETLKSIFEAKKISCVLDVGGNKGQYRDFLRHHVGYQGLVITFEPTKKNYEYCLDKSINDDNWIVFKYALGSTEENKVIKIMKSDAFSSFLNPSNQKISDFSSINKVEYTEVVEVKRLDAIWDDLNIDDSNIYLKMDTQGYDLEVFKGVLGRVDKISALQTEASLINIYDSMLSFFDHIRYLNDRAFDIAGMFPVCVDKQGRVIEFDVVMINRDL